jgi:hypothetical protein
MARTTFSGPVASENGFIGISASGKTLSILPPATLSADTVLVFPNGAGSAGQQLTTDGTGVLTWAASGGADFSSPPAIGTGTPNTGAFTFLTSTTSSSSTATSTATRGTFAALTVTDPFGSSNPITPSSGQGVQGRIAGSNLTSTATYYAGVLGQYSVTGTNASTFVKSGVLGVVGNTTTSADSAVMAWMDGDGGLTTARAGYAIGMTQSTGGSGFEYGMDLELQDAVGGGGSVQPYKKAEIRVSNDVVVMTGAGAPTDGITGDDFAGPGSMYVDISGANLYIQTGAINNPVWKLVTRAA